VKDALVIPANSVISAPDGTAVVMLAGSDSRAHQKPVKLGIRNGDDVQVLEGVSESDKVVANGAYGLPDKTKIKIEATPAEGSPEGSKGEGSKSEGSKSEGSEK
jgi:multidrug efflux system membrane fusion protein